MDLEQLLGPYGLTVALIGAVIFLAREVFKFYREAVAELRAKLDVALAGWAAQTAANQTLADAQAEKNRDEELRQRLGEAGK